MLMFLIVDKPVDIREEARYYDNYLWSGWAYRTWQTWHGNFQRTGRQALKGNITATNRRVKRLLRVPFALHPEVHRDPSFGYHIGTPEGNAFAIYYFYRIMRFDTEEDTFITLCEPRGVAVYSSLVLDMTKDREPEFLHFFLGGTLGGCRGTLPLDLGCCTIAPTTTFGVVDKESRILVTTTICWGGEIRAMTIKYNSRYRYYTVWQKGWDTIPFAYLSGGDFNKDGVYDVVVPYYDSVVIYEIPTGERLYKIPQGVARTGGVLVDDINSDGELELVIPKDKVYAYTYDGVLLWEFDPHVGYPISFGITSADIDYDGVVEVVVIADSMYVLNGRDGSRKWVVDVGGQPLFGQGAKLADIDPTNYGMEIMVPIAFGGGRGILRVYSSDGRLIWEEVFDSTSLVTGVSVGDIDMDGCSEILVGTFTNYGDVYEVYKIDGEGVRCGYLAGVEERVKGDEKVKVGARYVRFSGEYKVYSIDGRLVAEGRGGEVKLKRGVYFYVSGEDKGRLVVW